MPHRCPRMCEPPPQGPKYPGLAFSHPRAVSQLVPAHHKGPVVPVQAPQYPTGTQMSWLEPLRTRRNPNVLTWSPHTPGRCPSLAPPPAQGRQESWYGLGNTPEGPECPGQVLSGTHSTPDTAGCPGTGQPHLTGAREVPVGPSQYTTQVQAPRPEPTPVSQPQVSSRLEAPDPPRPPVPAPVPTHRPGPTI